MFFKLYTLMVRQSKLTFYIDLYIDILDKIPITNLYTDHIVRNEHTMFLFPYSEAELSGLFGN